MNKKKLLLWLLMIIASFITVIFLSNERKKYTNIFEYAIELANEEYAYAPKQVSYGMSKAEIFEAEHLDESSVSDYDTGVLWDTVTVKKVTENLKDIPFVKRFSLEEEYGFHLQCLDYTFVVTAEQVEEICTLLAEQAAEHMPEPSSGTLEGLKKGESVAWYEYASYGGNESARKCEATVKVIENYSEVGNYGVQLQLRIYHEYLTWYIMNYYMEQVDAQDVAEENFFEYAVDLKAEQYAYAPKQFAFGLSKEDILNAGKNGETVFYEDSTEAYALEAKYKHVLNVSENVDEMLFGTKLEFLGEQGLTDVVYSLIVKQEDFKDICEILCEQADTYMSGAEEGMLDKLIDGKTVTWYDEKTGSGVEISVEKYYGFYLGGKEIKIAVYTD